MQKGVRSKKTIIPFLIIVCFLCILLCAAAKADKTKILIETPLYASPDFDGDVSLEKLLRNETVEIIGEKINVNGTDWYQIRYTTYEGYVPAGYVFFTVGTDDYKVVVEKISASSMSEIINVYSYYDETSDVVGTLVDGEKVNVVLDQEDYGEFSKVVYNNGYYFVKKVNITTGLTYNQQIALIIVSVMIGLLVVGGVFGATVYRKKKKSAKPVSEDAEC